MIRLKNIVISEKNITCDIYPEGSENAGLMVFSIPEDKVVHYVLPDGYEWCKYHVLVHAANGLRKILNGDEDLEDKTIIWS